MSSLYCTCGFKNEYSGVKPKFCGSCGQPFDKLFKAVVTPPPVAVNVSMTQPNYNQPRQVQYSQYYSQEYGQPEKEFFDLDPSIIKIEGESTKSVTLREFQNNKNIDFSRQSSAGEEVRDVNLKPLSSVKNEYIEGMIGGKRREQVSQQAPRRESNRKTARRVSK